MGDGLREPDRGLALLKAARLPGFMPLGVFSDEKRGQEGAPHQHLSGPFTRLSSGGVFHDVADAQYLPCSCVQRVDPTWKFQRARQRGLAGAQVRAVADVQTRPLQERPPQEREHRGVRGVAAPGNGMLSYVRAVPLGRNRYSSIELRGEEKIDCQQICGLDILTQNKLQGENGPYEGADIFLIEILHP